MDGHSLCGTQTFCLRGDNSRSHLLKNMEPKRKINEKLGGYLLDRGVVQTMGHR